MSVPTISVVPFKLVLLGESSVGKTSIVLQFVRGQYFEYQEATIGAAFMVQTVPISDTLKIKFEIWDTAGQERYRSLAPMYYKGASAAVIVYDITSSDSFDKAKTWVNELQRHCGDIVICLAGNKIDLSSDRKVESKTAKAYADNNDLIYIECSAKTAENVKEIFLEISKKLPIQERLKAQENKKNKFEIYESEELDDQKSNGCNC